jgi:hypothetical protein
MNAGESPGQRYDKLQRAVQDAILQNYPNPDRVGCPGAEVLRTLATERLTRDRDPAWEHVTHCSPCYAEYLALVERVEQSRRRRNRVVRAAGLAALFALGFWIRGLVAPSADQPNAPEVVQQPATDQEPEVIAAVLNLESQSATRGGSTGAAEPGEEIQRLPRGRLALSIYLPRGSEPGPYEVRILPESGSGEPLLSVSGEAHIQKGLTRLDVSSDFSRLPPGRYVLATRREGLSWRNFRVLLN